MNTSTHFDLSLLTLEEEPVLIARRAMMPDRQGRAPSHPSRAYVQLFRDDALQGWFRVHLSSAYRSGRDPVAPRIRLDAPPGEAVSFRNLFFDKPAESSISTTLPTANDRVLRIFLHEAPLMDLRVDRRTYSELEMNFVSKDRIHPSLSVGILPLLTGPRDLDPPPQSTEAIWLYSDDFPRYSGSRTKA